MKTNRGVEFILVAVAFGIVYTGLYILMMCHESPAATDAGVVVFRSGCRFTKGHRIGEMTIYVSYPNLSNYIFYPLDWVYWRLIEHSDPAPGWSIRNKK